MSFALTGGPLARRFPIPQPVRSSGLRLLTLPLLFCADVSGVLCQEPPPAIVRSRTACSYISFLWPVALRWVGGHPSLAPCSFFFGSGFCRVSSVFSRLLVRVFFQRDLFCSASACPPFSRPAAFFRCFGRLAVAQNDFTLLAPFLSLRLLSSFAPLSLWGKVRETVFFFCCQRPLLFLISGMGSPTLRRGTSCLAPPGPLFLPALPSFPFPFPGSLSACFISQPSRL